jgi:nucleoside-diphosphate-sugar epimerase
MAKVLVTGASGFIGGHLVEALVGRGDEVTCLVRRSSAVERLRPLGVRLVYGDVTEPAGLRDAVAGNQVVYHAAGRIVALRAQQYYRVNTEGVRHVAWACAQQPVPPVLVHVSSLAAAGPARHGRLRTEADPLVQFSHYGRSKRAGELAAEEFADRVPITIVRPAIVFGEADRLALEMFRMVAQCGVYLVPGLGRYKVSLIHVADLVNLLVLAAQRGARIQPRRHDGSRAARGYYFAACQEHPGYADLARMIGDALGGRRVFPVPIATPLVWMVAAALEVVARIRRHPMYLNLDRAADVTAGSWVCSPRAAIEELGFSAEVPLRERLRQTATWYRKEGWL